MSIEQAIKNRIADLIGEGQQLRIGKNGSAYDEDHRQQCVAFSAPVQNVIQLVFPNPDSAYRKRSEAIISVPRGWTAPSAVGELTDLLSSLLKDIELGLIVSFANRVRAETFDDFLDHAEAYYKDGKKNESGVIAGVVFENTIRRVCEKQSIPQAGKKLDDLISELAKLDVISAMKAKRARSSAHVRTKATHAQWDEFDLNDVKATIDFSRELISEKLDG